MSAKRNIRMATDIAMTILLPILMAYSLVGEAVHEWLGIVMFLLFIIHHAFNWRWYKNLVRGPYLPMRILSAGVNLLLVIIMVTLPVSGIIMAKHTFHFIHFRSGAASARLIHLLASYWGFVLMCLHLGLHWGMVLGMVRRVMHITEDLLWRTWLSRIVAAFVAAYGAYAFFVRGFTEYMFLRTQFVFYDFGEPLPSFFMDYLAVMALFVYIGHYMAEGIARYSKRKKTLFYESLQKARD
ncbi:MAG: DUF4405 domain-containing protein [Lachnospiraceae bacterium]|nr:DUF4405 domain-containing protein [Lachnospiraceae bacterium]